MPNKCNICVICIKTCILIITYMIICIIICKIICNMQNMQNNRQHNTQIKCKIKMKINIIYIYILRNIMMQKMGIKISYAKHALPNMLMSRYPSGIMMTVQVDSEVGAPGPSPSPGLEAGSLGRGRAQSSGRPGHRDSETRWWWSLVNHGKDVRNSTLVVRRRQLARVELLVSSKELHAGYQQGEGTDLNHQVECAVAGWDSER